MIYLKNYKKDGEITRATLMEYHNLTPIQLNRIILKAKNNRFEIDGNVYIINKDTPKKSEVTGDIYKKYKGEIKPGDIYKKYKGEITHLYNVERRDYILPRSLKRTYVCGDKEYSIPELAAELKLPYDYTSAALKYVDSFDCKGETYKIKVYGKLYDIFYREKLLKTRVTVGQVLSTVDLTAGATVEVYVNNNWYTKEGYRIKRSKK